MSGSSDRLRDLWGIIEKSEEFLCACAAFVSLREVWLCVEELSNESVEMHVLPWLLWNSGT